MGISDQEHGPTSMHPGALIEDGVQAPLCGHCGHRHFPEDMAPAGEGACAVPDDALPTARIPQTGLRLSPRRSARPRPRAR